MYKFENPLFLCLKEAQRKSLQKETPGKKVSPSAEGDSRLCLENPRAFEKARPKLSAN